MTVTMAELRGDVMYRLGDAAGTIWSSTVIDSLIQEGYDDLVKRSGCIWDQNYLPDRQATFNYTQAWELDYIPGGWEANGPANYTHSFERDWVDNGSGPANMTSEWEADYATEKYVEAVAQLPELLDGLERATWNNKKLHPLMSRDFENWDSRYELNTGNVEGYVRDKDGFMTLRKWRVPATAYEGNGLTSPSSQFGILRSISAIDSSEVNGSWGELRVIDNHDVGNGPFGITRMIGLPANNVRVEFQRMGRELNENQPLEVPDWHTVYIRHYVMWKALFQDGPGQQIGLSSHYQQRYEVGLKRIVRRRTQMDYSREIRLRGDSAYTQRRMPRARLPWQYGPPVR